MSKSIRPKRPYSVSRHLVKDKRESPTCVKGQRQRAWMLLFAILSTGAHKLITIASIKPLEEIILLANSRFR